MLARSAHLLIGVCVRNEISFAHCKKWRTRIPNQQMEVRGKQAVDADMGGDHNSFMVERDGIVTPRPIIGILAQARVC